MKKLSHDSQSSSHGPKMVSFQNI